MNYLSSSADFAGALASPGPASDWEGVNNQVINWEWHYTPAGGGKVKMGTNGRMTPFAPTLPTPASVSGNYGFFGTSKTGDGVPALVGTVTMLIISDGTYQGGAIQLPGFDTFSGSAASGVASVSGGHFSIVPEPSSIFLLSSGLTALAIRRRRAA